MIKYLGSKRRLIPTILGAIEALEDVSSAIDLFSGTSRVGHALKRAGIRVLANDHNAYAATLARCYVQADAEDVIPEATKILAALSALPGQPGYFTETFCVRSRFFQPKNGARIDAMRDAIDELDLSEDLLAVVLTSLMEAADRVDSTTGLQMAYLKQWAARSHRDLTLRVPDVLPAIPAGRCEAHQLDARTAATTLRADLAYIDPPYNQHKYLGNYHIWETLVRWDRPESYGVACKRVDCRDRKSPFNSRPRFKDAFAAIIAGLQVRYMVVSFSDEGFISRPELEALLLTRGEVTVISQDHPRYVGARIGIYSPSGQKVGRVSHLENTEHIYVVKVRS